MKWWFQIEGDGRICRKWINSSQLSRDCVFAFGFRKGKTGNLVQSGNILLLRKPLRLFSLSTYRDVKCGFHGCRGAHFFCLWFPAKLVLCSAKFQALQIQIANQSNYNKTQKFWGGRNRPGHVSADAFGITFKKITS